MNIEQKNKLIQSIHQQNKDVGWWDEENPCIATKLQLVNTEIAEATEAERKDLMDDHLPERKGGEVELADALIRVYDLMGYLNIELFDLRSQPKTFESLYRSYDTKGLTIGEAHLQITELVVRIYRVIYTEDFIDMDVEVAFALFDIIVRRLGQLMCYDIDAAMEEKIAYNAQRADHKRENRAKEGGKNF